MNLTQIKDMTKDMQRPHDTPEDLLDDVKTQLSFDGVALNDDDELLLAIFIKDLLKGNI